MSKYWLAKEIELLKALIFYEQHNPQIKDSEKYLDIILKKLEPI